jgi:hypothetical protein
VSDRSPAAGLVEPALFTPEIPDSLPEAFGFRNGERGVHSSRSLMYADLEHLLDSTPADSGDAGYREELDGENLLGKRTATNRDHTARKLRALYGLDPEITVFRLLRHFWELDDGHGRPLLALLCATARDPLLRSLTPALLKTPIGTALEEAALQQQFVASGAEARFSESTRRAILSKVVTSWRTSGHLQGRERVRIRAEATPAAAAYALALGHLEGRRGTLLFDSLWARLLDSPEEELRELAQVASQNGWLVYRGIGDVVEVRFPDLWTPAEEARLDE